MTIQIAVKLEDDVAARLDRLVSQGSFPNRSQAVRTAVEALVRGSERRHIDAAFVEGFTTFPETDEEMAEAERMAISAIDEEPWDRWW